MRPLPPLALAFLLLTTPVGPARADAGRQDALVPAEPVVPADIEVRTSLSQTAIWIGNTVTFTVSLTCKPGVDVLQEDLGADKLTLDGLQVVGHALQRRVTADARTHYEVVYQLTTFEPGAETLSIGDWTVRYTTGSEVQGVSRAASDLRIPGAVLAWRSALPAALKALEARSGRAVVAAPSWWRAAGPAGLASLVVSATIFGWLLFSRLSAGRTRKPRRSLHRESARDLRGTIKDLRATDIGSTAQRLTAYATLEAAVRRHVASVTSVPGLALTPGECRERLTAIPAPFPADAIGRILGDCQEARYQPVEQVPGEDRFRATLEAAANAFADSR